ncbi:MAG: phosphotransferase [Candidatus Thorarchaeota archaeon]
MNQDQIRLLEYHRSRLLSHRILERHFGISHDLIHSISVKELVDIGELPGMLVTWHVKLKEGSEKLVSTWFSSETRESMHDRTAELSGQLLWENIDDLNMLFQKTILSGEHGRVAFVHGSSALLHSINKTTKGKEETTNQHFVFHTPKTRIRAKIYSDTQKGHKEARMVSRLASAKIHPAIVGSLDLIGLDGRSTGTLALFSTELAGVKNLDLLTGQIYSRFVQGEITESECLDGLKKYVQLAVPALARMHSVLNTQGMSSSECELHFRRIKESFAQKISRHAIRRLKLSSDRKATIDCFLDRILRKSGASWIHGDIWWRQFIIDEEKNIFIIDFEDAQISFLAYDIGSWISSILQQGEYYLKDLVGAQRIKVKGVVENLIAHLWNKLKSLEPYKRLSRVEVDLGRFLRSIHELDYLTTHQPSETWLLEFIEGNCLEIVTRLELELMEI